jgi:hypothetical protein
VTAVVAVVGGLIALRRRGERPPEPATPGPATPGPATAGAASPEPVTPEPTTPESKPEVAA